MPFEEAEMKSLMKLQVHIQEVNSEIKITTQLHKVGAATLDFEEERTTDGLCHL